MIPAAHLARESYDSNGNVIAPGEYWQVPRPKHQGSWSSHFRGCPVLAPLGRESTDVFAVTDTANKAFADWGQVFAGDAIIDLRSPGSAAASLHGNQHPRRQLVLAPGRHGSELAQNSGLRGRWRRGLVRGSRRRRWSLRIGCGWGPARICGCRRATHHARVG